MGRYISPDSGTSSSSLLPRLVADEASIQTNATNIATLQAMVATLNSDDTLSKSEIAALQAAVANLQPNNAVAYKNIAPVMNSVLPQYMQAGVTYNTATNRITAPAAGYILTNLSFICGSCSGGWATLRVNGVPPAFNNGQASGWAGNILDYKIVTAGTSYSSVGSFYLANNCGGMSYITLEMTLLSYFIPTA